MVMKHGDLALYTPLKFNIAPEKDPFEKVTFQGYVSFREGMVLYSCPAILRECILLLNAF